MKYIRQFGIIIIVSFLGELLNKLIPLPIPGSIYGLVIMFIALKTKIILLYSVKDTGKFLVEIMPLMFIPPAVELLNLWDTLKPMIISLITITIISTIIVMAVSGRITQRILRIEKIKEAEKDE